MELVQRDVERGQGILFDRAVLEAFQRVAQNIVGLFLQGVQLRDGGAVAGGRDHVEQTVAPLRVASTFVATQIAAQPRAAGQQARDHHQSQPHEVAVALQEGALGAVDVGGRAGVRWDRGGLVGVGHLDVGDTGKIPLQHVPDREQLLGERGHRQFRQFLAGDDQVVHGDRRDVVVRPRGTGAEGAGGDFGGFVDRMLAGDDLRRIDRDECRRAAGPGGGVERLGGDLAVGRADRQEGIDLLVAQRLADFGDAELGDGHLVAGNAGLGQDEFQQVDVGRSFPDHADAAAVEVGDGLGRFLALRSRRVRHPQDNQVLAEDRRRQRVAGQVQVGPHHREVGGVVGDGGCALRCAFGGNHAQPDIMPFAGERLGHLLDDLDVLAARRSDRDAQCGRPPVDEQVADQCGDKQEQAAGQHDERETFHEQPLSRQQVADQAAIGTRQ